MSNFESDSTHGEFPLSDWFALRRTSMVPEAFLPGQLTALRDVPGWVDANGRALPPRILLNLVLDLASASSHALADRVSTEDKIQLVRAMAPVFDALCALGPRARDPMYLFWDTVLFGFNERAHSETLESEVLDAIQRSLTSCQQTAGLIGLIDALIRIPSPRALALITQIREVTPRRRRSVLAAADYEVAAMARLLGSDGHELRTP